MFDIISYEYFDLILLITDKMWLPWTSKSSPGNKPPAHLDGQLESPH